jgi:hypothetical protein
MRAIEKTNVMMLEPLVCSIQAATKILGRCERSIKDMIAKGELQAIKSDARTLIVVQSMKDYVAGAPPAKGTPNSYPRAAAVA